MRLLLLLLSLNYFTPPMSVEEFDWSISTAYRCGKADALKVELNDVDCRPVRNLAKDEALYESLIGKRPTHGK